MQMLLFGMRGKLNAPARPVRPRARAPAGRSKAAVRRRPAPDAAMPALASQGTMQAKYDAMVRQYLTKYRVRVRKWRTSMSGVAWQIRYTDGSVSRLIEAPYPRGPMSAAVFLHEIGHHAIGFTTYRLRCLEEYHAWRFALAEMERLGLNITEGVRRRVHDSLHYAIRKGERRGLKALPAELMVFATPWAGSRPARRRRSA